MAFTPTGVRGTGPDPPRPDPDFARNRVQGKILDIGYLGNLSTYHVELPEGPVIKCEVGNRSRLSRRDFTWEDEVWLSWTKTAGLVLPR